jgi:hypothetical protein
MVVLNVTNVAAIRPELQPATLSADRKRITLPSGTVVFPNGTIVAKNDHFCDGFTVDLGRVVEDPNAVCYGEETHLQSWAFGDMNKLSHVVERDPVTLQPTKVVVDTDNTITKAYRKDPIRFRLIHPGIKETHTWHQHTMRWFHDPKNDKSARLDVQSTGPGQTFELNMEPVGCLHTVRYTQGAGPAQQVLLRQRHQAGHRLQPGRRSRPERRDVHADGEPRQPGDARGAGAEGQPLSSFNYVDGTPIEPLQSLPDRTATGNPNGTGNVTMIDPNTGQPQVFKPTPAPDATHPGFPLWVKGEYAARSLPAGVQTRLRSWRTTRSYATA